MRVEILIASFSSFSNGIPIDSKNVKVIIMTSATQDDFPFLLLLNVNKKKHVVIRCLRGGKKTVYVCLINVFSFLAYRLESNQSRNEKLSLVSTNVDPGKVSVSEI